MESKNAWEKLKKVNPNKRTKLDASKAGAADARRYEKGMINMCRNTLLLLAVLSFSAEVSAGVYKCTNEEGKVSFQEAPCDSGQSQTEIQQQKPKARTCAQRWKHVSDAIVEEINKMHREKTATAEAVLEKVKISKTSDEILIIDGLYSELVDPVNRFHSKLVEKMQGIPALYRSTNEDQSLENCKANEFENSVILEKYRTLWDKVISSLERGLE